MLETHRGKTHRGWSVTGRNQSDTDLAFQRATWFELFSERWRYVIIRYRTDQASVRSLDHIRTRPRRRFLNRSVRPICRHVPKKKSRVDDVVARTRLGRMG